MRPKGGPGSYTRRAAAEVTRASRRTDFGIALRLRLRVLSESRCSPDSIVPPVRWHVVPADRSGARRYAPPLPNAAVRRLCCANIPDGYRHRVSDEPRYRSEPQIAELSVKGREAADFLYILWTDTLRSTDTSNKKGGLHARQVFEHHQIRHGMALSRVAASPYPQSRPLDSVGECGAWLHRDHRYVLAPLRRHGCQPPLSASVSMASAKAGPHCCRHG
jgi:hypothetical protein